MKTLIRNTVLGLTVVALAALVYLAFDFVRPASTGFTFASWFEQAKTPAPLGDPIPMKPLTDLTSFESSVRLDVNGLIDGERTEGDLTAKVIVADGNKSKVTVSGSLLGPIVARVGGSLVSLVTPSSVDLYKMPDGAYITIGGFIPVCVKPKALNATEALDELSPQNLLALLTDPEVARGKFVSEGEINGVKAKRYVIDGDAFLETAQNSENEKLQKFAENLWSADDIYVWVDSKTGYPIALKGNFTGAFEPLGFEGDIAIDLALTNANAKTDVRLPNSCNRPIVQ
jgi:hypothetical protein